MSKFLPRAHGRAGASPASGHASNIFQLQPLAALVVLAFGVAAWPAYAQDGGGNSSASTTLPTVTVTDTAPTQSAAERGQIERMRAATSDTAALLAGIPGVSVRAAGGVSGFPVIQGVADDRLRVKVDGMDLTASCPNHMNTPLSYLPPSDAGQLKVHSNIAPVSVGGDSIGGSILAESAAPKFARPGESRLIEGELGTYYRSNGNARGGNAAATFATDALSLSYTGSVARANDYWAGGNFKTNTATGRPGYGLALDKVGSSAYLTRNQSLGLAVRADNHLVEARYSYQDIPYELYPNQRMDMLGNTANRFNLRYLGAFNWGELDARAYHEKVDHHMDFGPDRQFVYAGGTGMPMDTQGKTAGATVKASIHLAERDVLRVGGEYLRYRLDDTWPPSAAPGATSGMGPRSFININNGKRDRAAAFTEWEANWSQNWLSLIGVRFERVTSNTGPVSGYNDMAPYLLSSVGTLDDFNAMNRRRTDNNWDFTALGRYTPSENSSYEFGFAHKTRSPNLYERYAWSRHGMALVMNNFLGDGNGYLGNPNLKPESANTLSVTGDWHSADGATALKVTPYYSHVNHYIDAVCTAGQGGGITGGCPYPADRFVPLQYVNQKARIHGIDLSGQMPLAKTGVGAFGLKGLVSYTRGKNLDTGDGLYNIMPLNGKLTLTHEYAGWRNALELAGVKSKTRVSAVRNEIKTPGYALMNLRASYAWKQVRFDFGVENLLNKRYFLPTGGAYIGQGTSMQLNGVPWGTAVPGMGRSVYMGVNIKF